eukprot:TRINITY_DN4599_c0_g1_i2.p1 TRINITY_DN4599_c0_g1~~TRINITY_DN4599_c0_g1_i2.p1  ORF type:complete len:146 (-),score=26.13 TRINITY_DN4599_c0_g1_i2:99-536(-)
MHTHTKINTNSALEHTIRLAKNTIEIGDHSITTLHHQELQLKNMQKELNTMNDDLNTGERLLRSIESVGGQISNWFRSDRSHKHQDEGEQFEADMEQIKEDRTRFEFARYLVRLFVILMLLMGLLVCYYTVDAIDDVDTIDIIYY